MQPYLTVLTLGVADLDRALAFYRDGLGLPTDGIIGSEFQDGAVVFFEMNPGLVLALYPFESLAKEASIQVDAVMAPSFTLGHNVASREEVDQILQKARQAGGNVTSPARDRFWGGYSGYFQDLDGHLWEIAWNPGWSLAGTMTAGEPERTSSPSGIS